MGKNHKKGIAKSSYSKQQKIKDSIMAERLKDIVSASASLSDAAMPEESEKPLKKRSALLETLWFGLDYGSILTAFSLYNTVQSLGIKASLMDKPPQLWTDHYSDPENIAGKFIRKYCPIEHVCNSDAELRRLADKNDAVIVGSDIIWSYDVCTRQTQNRYFLDYVSDSIKKLSFASSFGYTYSGPFGEELKQSARYLRRFDSISVSNFENQEILRERFGIDGEIVLDPVFLCGTQSFVSAAEKAPCRTAEKENRFIFTYIKHGNARKRELVLRGNDILAPKSFSPMRCFIDINAYPESKAALGLEVAWHITVEDWLYYIINSEFVITDDYYGICFALIFNKPFVFVESVNYAAMNNIKALLSSLGLEERIVNTEDDFRKKEYLFRMPIRYKKVNRLLQSMKEKSLKWLNEALNDKNQA